MGGRAFGNRESPVQIEADWHAAAPVPDLDAVPPVATATGVDLEPLDVSDADDRRWLEALVWPDNRHEAERLRAAMDVVAADPPPVRAGSAVDVCPALAAELPPGEPRVVFHPVTKLHVPPGERHAFDAANASLGANAPLYELALERAPDADPRPQPARVWVALSLRGPGEPERLLAVVDARVAWVEPVDV